MKAKTNGITVTPVKKYAAPKYPTQTAAEREPELLRRLPPRWEQNVRVAAAVTMIGAMTLSGCGIKKTDNSSAVVVPATEIEIAADIGALAGEPAMVEFTTEQDMTIDTGDLAGEILVELTTEQNFTAIETTENDNASFLNVAPIFFHGEGTGAFGGVPLMDPYAVLSEQEAFAIINSAAASAGLNFSADPPDYTATKNKTGNKYLVGDEYCEEELGDGSVGLNFYDRDKRVAVAYIPMGEATEMPLTSTVIIHRPRELAELVAEDFSRQKGEITIGVFYDPGVNYEGDKLKLEEDLRAQVRDFVAWLQNQGII